MTEPDSGEGSSQTASGQKVSRISSSNKIIKPGAVPTESGTSKRPSKPYPPGWYYARSTDLSGNETDHVVSWGRLEDFMLYWNDKEAFTATCKDGKYNTRLVYQRWTVAGDDRSRLKREPSDLFTVREMGEILSKLRGVHVNLSGKRSKHVRKIQVKPLEENLKALEESKSDGDAARLDYDLSELKQDFSLRDLEGSEWWTQSHPTSSSH